jgi:hypothetical protein
MVGNQVPDEVPGGKAEVNEGNNVPQNVAGYVFAVGNWSLPMWRFHTVWSKAGFSSSLDQFHANLK